LKHRFLDFGTNYANAVVMVRQCSANGKQRRGLATRTARAAIAYGFTVAAQKSFGEIDEGRLLHEFTSARTVCAILFKFLSATTRPQSMPYENQPL
jgi:hypothetical protein